MPPNGNGDVLPTLALVGQLGAIVVACVLAGLMAGHYLDRLFGSSPVLTTICLLAGVAGSMAAVYRLVMRTVERDQRRRGQGPS
jgi:F0F1-type ATP synthase assembly protein I